MIIARNNTEREQTKRQVLILVENLNRHLEAYAQTGLPEIKGNTLKDFASDPVGTFHSVLSAQAKEKGMEGVNPAEYAKLFNITFAPNLTRYPVAVQYLNFAKMEKGRVIPAPDLDIKLDSLGVVTVTDPEEVEAATLLLRLSKEFAYASTLLSGGDAIKTAGLQTIGFGLTNMLHLSRDTVKHFAARMKEIPRKDFTERLVEQFGNPGLKEV